MGGKKKEEEDDVDDDDDEDPRMAGMDAKVFSQPIGYVPSFPTPPKYIRVHSRHKQQRDFNQTFLAQELNTRFPSDGGSRPVSVINPSETSIQLPQHKSGAIWAMKFSKDGRYLAAAGEDMVVRIWQVLSSKQDREEHEREEEAVGGDGSYPTNRGVRLNAPLVRSQPLREYHGHSGDVLDLSWSKNNFLLSSSMDKTVRLWHVSRKECLCSFQHTDFVTSIAFHPKDDRFFLAGSLDSKLRLWSIPDKVVAYWVEVQDLITAIAFTPDGRTAIVGCLNGRCVFYDTEGLKYHSALHVRSSRGKNSDGSKITGIETFTIPPGDPSGDTKILISSNDSRIRMYHARDKSLELKFKGYANTCSQIHATFSDDGKYVISGSEDRRVYVWNLSRPDGADRKEKRPVEFFEAAHPGMVTVALLAPTPTRELLSLSGDPLYDLCNPPPVTLVDSSDPIDNSRPPSPAPSVSQAPVNTAWLERAKHFHGNIIVTADYNGKIKIFRQDCAAAKRKQEIADTEDSLSKRILRKGSLRSQHSGRANDDRSSWRRSIGSVRSVETRGGSLRNWRNSLHFHHLPTPASPTRLPDKPRNPPTPQNSGHNSPTPKPPPTSSTTTTAASSTRPGSPLTPSTTISSQTPQTTDSVKRYQLTDSPVPRRRPRRRQPPPPPDAEGPPSSGEESEDEKDVFADAKESNSTLTAAVEDEGVQEAVRCGVCGGGNFRAVVTRRRGEEMMGLRCVKCGAGMRR
ncbi:WD40 repeat-like protein [Ascodesmis nigricans]|uniref:WD40 repeat-like protein n=1 Tax=Ascodesmis nigricans TaxID=341454 RepID=A0A4S2MK10_9PEZI|nr:WD40 repeat-like protein [Ascodesmis nigricans]